MPKAARLVGWTLAGLGLAAAILAAQAPAAAKKLDSQQQIVQALNRLTWGIAPGDVALVQRLGLKNWLNQQLHPDKVVENPELADALAPLATLRMSPAEMMQRYPFGAAAKNVRQDATEANRKEEADARTKLASLLAPGQVTSLSTGNPRQRVMEIESLPANTREAVLAALPRSLAQPLDPWLPLAQQRELVARMNPQQVVALDLLDSKVLRAVYTNRQLEDVLTDFWFNHFNIYIRKDLDRNLITSYERDAIRPHVLGKFSDLLLATAESPAMMFYLDNWQSVDPNSLAMRRRRAAAKPGTPVPGINENYGREVMELQTLGVNGGYTQTDVTEVARCFTGWTIFQPRQHAAFFYNDNLHDKGAKVVLGHKIPAGGGMNDGLEVIQILAHSPATAHHLSYELAQRFVADEPPPALVNRMANTFLHTDGDLRQVMQTMINSPEFWETAYYRDKVKSPLEMVVSAVRALGADVSNPTRLTQVIASMGQPLYAKEPPTGYENVGAAWVSSSGLIARLNFAMQLARDQVPGVQVDVDALAGVTAAPDLEQKLFQDLLYDQASASTRSTIERTVASLPNQTPALPVQIAGLVLGSPDFQRR